MYVFDIFCDHSRLWSPAWEIYRDFPEMVELLPGTVEDSTEFHQVGIASWNRFLKMTAKFSQLKRRDEEPREQGGRNKKRNRRRPSSDSAHEGQVKYTSTPKRKKKNKKKNKKKKEGLGRRACNVKYSFSSRKSILRLYR